jgi:hypothetical protein
MPLRSSASLRPLALRLCGEIPSRPRNGLIET